MKKIFALIIIASVSLTSCSKYKDGPKISLLTKKARFTGHWTIEQAAFNGTDITSATLTAAGNFRLDILKSGRYGVQGNFGDYGTWKFGEDKDDVTFTSEVAGVEPKAYHILRLENKSLWLQYTAPNGDVTETHYKQ